MLDFSFSFFSKQIPAPLLPSAQPDCQPTSELKKSESRLALEVDLIKLQFQAMREQILSYSDHDQKYRIEVVKVIFIQIIALWGRLFSSNTLSSLAEASPEQAVLMQALDFSLAFFLLLVCPLLVIHFYGQVVDRVKYIFLSALYIDELNQALKDRGVEVLFGWEAFLKTALPERGNRKYSKLPVFMGLLSCSWLLGSIFWWIKGVGLQFDEPTGLLYLYSAVPLVILWVLVKLLLYVNTIQDRKQFEKIASKP